MSMSLVFPEEIKKWRGWGFKDWESVINRKADNFSMNFLIAASEKNFYGIMANCKTNNSEIFWYFLRNVWNCRSNNFDSPVSSFCFVMDNASIHKTKNVKELWEENGLSIITIPSYWPSLNPIETVIHSIKMKVKQSQSGGR